VTELPEALLAVACICIAYVAVAVLWQEVRHKKSTKENG